MWCLPKPPFISLIGEIPIERTLKLAQDALRPRFQHKGGLFALEGQRSGNRDRGLGEKRKRGKGEREGIFDLRNERLPLNKEAIRL